ncbi:aldehyde dehydrogenase [Patellaria atrata CBS 101060]|uniref:Aldehyde dehydrogenase n=1 Tax=Patellaria atrata CBS 101060 TaxID=1346257 RepID=A0A9P4VVP0_9PEZI|nr:aldehyde dehydrogenase [Patellaria atrata CBS 101060]
MSKEIPQFEHTHIDAIPGIVKAARTAFRSHRTRPLEYRLKQLRKLYWAVSDNADAIIEACTRDLGKPVTESIMTEVGWVKNDIVFVINHLEKWMKDEKPDDIQLTHKVANPRIRKDPLGTVLVIGAFNFPIQLSLGPFVGAIAAGCTGILKPSEGSPNAAAMLQKIVSSSLDPEAYAVVQGAVPETSALLNEKWDKIFYTGSPRVGTIIAKKAAETLTPVTLELGGRNPAIVTKHADPRLTARRLVWAKTLNAGQCCVSQNYTLVDKEILPQLLEEMKIALNEFYPRGAQESLDYGRIVNTQHFHRLKKMLDDSNGKILYGGTMDEATKFIEPTIVQVESSSDSLVVEESFGPFITLFPVTNLDEAITIANEVCDTPLAVYPFGSKAEMKKVLDETRSGGASLNDGFFHACLPTLSFGGVGSSGQGAYRGKTSFEAFVHRRSVTTTPNWLEKLLDVRYPPFNQSKLRKYQQMSDAKPDFDREGRRIGWVGWFVGLLGLGGEGKTGALGRWVLLILVFVGLKQWKAKSS